MMMGTMVHASSQHGEAPREQAPGVPAFPAPAGIPSGHQRTPAPAVRTGPAQGPASSRLLVLGALLLLSQGCSIDRFPLPDVAGVDETGFGAGDSSYLLLNRQILLPAGADPADLFINDDGHVYVAERGSGRISVWDQALDPVAEAGLEDFLLPGVKGVAVGPEQLLYAVAGDSVLWAHNLAAAREPLTWGLTGAIARHRDAPHVIDTLDAAALADKVADRTIVQWEFLSVDSVDLADAAFRARLQPHRLWTGSGSTRLDAVARGRAGRREVFVANNNPSGGSELRRIRLRPSAMLFTSNPDVAVIYLYDAAGSERVTPPGTGVGTVDLVTGLDADAAGSLYLTQTAPTVGYWKAQRLTVEEFAGADYWSFDFSLQGRRIMRPEQFADARDITYTSTGIFVLDRRPAVIPEEAPAHRVQVFRRSGDYLLPLGARRVLADTTLMVDGAPVDTLLKVWVYDQLQDPRGVAVYGNRSDRAGNEDEIIYVADRDQGRDLIKLFMLSASTSGLPVE